MHTACLCHPYKQTRVYQLCDRVCGVICNMRHLNPPSPNNYHPTVPTRFGNHRGRLCELKGLVICQRPQLTPCCMARSPLTCLNGMQRNAHCFLTDHQVHRTRHTGALRLLEMDSELCPCKGNSQIIQDTFHACKTKTPCS